MICTRAWFAARAVICTCTTDPKPDTSPNCTWSRSLGNHIQAPLEEFIADAQHDFPDLGTQVIDMGYTFTIPGALRTTHESHFAMVLEDFLDYVDTQRWPDWLLPGIRMRYELLARARELALT